MKKIKIHIRNNHWKEGFLPCDPEGEKHSTITSEEFEKGLLETIDWYKNNTNYWKSSN